MNSMGSHEYRGPHPLHDRIEQLERENKLLREAIGSVLTDVALFMPWKDMSKARLALAAVGEK